MSKDTGSYEDFLNEVEPVYRDFVSQTNDYMLENGYKLKLERAKNGFVASYTGSKSKRVVINFVFRKAGLVIRIYGDNVNKYIDFMQTLPAGMLKAIEKAPNCKRLLDLSACNSRCPMGYDFAIKDELYKKCRYSSFMFLVNDENIPFINDFVKNEVRERENMQ